MQNQTTVHSGPWSLVLHSRPHPVHPGLIAAELRYSGLEEPVIDLRDGPFAPVRCEFGQGPVLRIELAMMSNPHGGTIRAEIDLDHAEWTGGGSNGRQPVARFIERFANPAAACRPWPARAVPQPQPAAPVAPDPVSLPAPTPLLAPASNSASPACEPDSRGSPVLRDGPRREMRSKDGVWLFDLEENGRFELAAGGRERPYYDVRVVRLADGKVVANTRSRGYEGWVIGDEIQISRPSCREPWIVVDTVYGEFWLENARGPLSEVQDVATLAQEW